MEAIAQTAIDYIRDSYPDIFSSVSADRIVLDKTNFYDKSMIIMVHVLVNEGQSDVFRVWVEIEVEIEFSNLRVVRGYDRK